MFFGARRGKPQLKSAYLRASPEGTAPLPRQASGTGLGFEIEAKSDLLRNADDDRKKTVFDPEIRGKTDRFVMRLRKPE